MDTVWRLKLNYYFSGDLEDESDFYFEGKPCLYQILKEVNGFAESNEQPLNSTQSKHFAERILEEREDYIRGEVWNLTAKLSTIETKEGEAKYERYINGVLIPPCEREAPPNGTVYYIPTILSALHHDYQELLWEDDGIDGHYLDDGWVFLNKEDAQEVTKAITAKITGETK